MTIPPLIPFVSVCMTCKVVYDVQMQPPCSDREWEVTDGLCERCARETEAVA